MKKIALFLMAAFAFAACEEEFVPHLDFPPTEVTIPTAGTEDLAEPVTVTFTANADWTAELKGEGVAEWLSISPKSGVAGKSSIKLDAIANTAKENRTATLAITVKGMEPALVTVTQLQKNAIDVNAEDAYTVPFAGESIEIEVGHNVAYTYEITYADPENTGWIVETKAYTTDKCTFTVAAQPVAGVERTAYVTVYSELGVVKNITIVQEKWSPIDYSKSLSQNNVPAGVVKIALSGENAYILANGEVHAFKAATGEYVSKLTLPEGFVPGSLAADQAGNVIIAGPNADYDWSGVSHPDILIYKMTDPNAAPEELIRYNVGNAWGCVGNAKVTGDITKNAIVTLVTSGSNVILAFEVVNGKCIPSANNAAYAEFKAVNAPYTAGGAPNHACALPAGPTLADGILFFAYGQESVESYNVMYCPNIAAGQWGVAAATAIGGNDNPNSLAIATLGDKSYLAAGVGSHFSYSVSQFFLYDVTDKTASGIKLFNLPVQQHTLQAAGMPNSDIAMRVEGNDLVVYVVDSYRDCLDRYVFSSDIL